MLIARNTEIQIEKPLIFSIINLDPDSFAGDGKLGYTPESLPEKNVVLDIGAASSRPGASATSATEQIDRLARLELYSLSTQSLVSLDTWDPVVAEYGLKNGVHIINDVSGAENEALLDAVAYYRAGYVLMYNRHVCNPAASNAKLREAAEIEEDMKLFFKSRLLKLTEHGILQEQVILDLGIGFGYCKGEHLRILKHIPVLRNEFDRPILVGHSRKRFLQRIANVTEPTDADIVTTLYSVEALRQGASIIRVHNLTAAQQALAFYAAL